MKKDEKNQRDTKQRRIIYENARCRRDHPKADDIYSDVHEQDSRISKGTVYRNLKLLTENGDLNRIVVPGADRFDSRTDPHYHIICTECGKVIDAPNPYEAENDKTVAEQTGFRISGHRTVFEGICPECLKKTQSTGQNGDYKN